MTAPLERDGGMHLIEATEIVSCSKPKNTYPTYRFRAAHSFRYRLSMCSSWPFSPLGGGGHHWNTGVDFFVNKYFCGKNG